MSSISTPRLGVAGIKLFNSKIQSIGLDTVLRTMWLALTMGNGDITNIRVDTLVSFTSVRDELTDIPTIVRLVDNDSTRTLRVRETYDEILMLLQDLYRNSGEVS